MKVVIAGILASFSICSGFIGAPHITAFKNPPRINWIRKLACSQPSEEFNFNGTRAGYQIVQTLTLPKNIVIKHGLDGISERELREDGISLPSALHLCFPEYYPSMSAARKAVRRGEILSSVDGTTVICNTSNAVLGGETLQVQKRLQPGLFPQGPAPFEMQVVYEDDLIAVVIKPPGVVTTKNKGQNGRLSVKSGLAYCLTPTRDTVDPLRRPIPAHRLDCATGGLLLAAKTHSAIVDLTRQFVGRLVRKRYVALVAGCPAGDDGAGRGRIAAPLSGQDALTDYEVTESVHSLKHGWVSEVSLRPHTGRTHQVPGSAAAPPDI